MTQTFSSAAPLIDINYVSGGAVSGLAAPDTAYTQHSLNTGGTTAAQRLTVFGSTAADLASNNYYGSLTPRPCIINLGMSGWETESYQTSFNAGGGITNRLIYELLKRDWVAVSVGVTETDTNASHGLTGNGAAHLPGEAKFLDTSRPAWNKDVVMAIQFLRMNAKALNIDPNRIYGFGASSSSQILAWAGTRTHVADELGDSSTYSQYAYDHGLAGLIGINLPWLFDAWTESKTVVGQVSAVSSDSDTPGSTLASIQTKYRRGFSPYHWMKGPRGKMIPMYLAYTADKVEAPLEPPFGAGLQTDVHPVIMGEIAKKQFSGPYKDSGLPMVKNVAMTVDGTTPAFGDPSLTERLSDTTATLETPLLRSMLDWAVALDKYHAPAYYDRPKTRVIITPASSEWVCAIPDNADRVGDVVISGFNFNSGLSGLGSATPILLDDAAGAASSDVAIDVDQGTGNPSPQVAVGARFTVDSENGLVHTVTAVAADTPGAGTTRLTFVPALTAAVANNAEINFLPNTRFEVMLSQTTMLEPANTTYGDPVVINSRDDDGSEVGAQPRHEFRFSGPSAAFVRSAGSAQEFIMVHGQV